MKKISKIFVLFALAISISCTNVNALNKQNVPTIIIECIDGIYENNANYNIVDDYNNNIKDNFITNNDSKYKDQDYEAIYDYISNNQITFEIKNNTIQPRESSTYNLTKVFVHTYQFNSGKKYTFGVECYAVVRVNENNGIITSYSGPSISLYQPSGGGGVSESLTSVSTKKELGSTNRSIVFTYSYKYKVVESGSYGQSTTYETPLYTEKIKYPS